ncbi:hypothetical protein Sjap_020668 [Stephania japonica]|uniref:Uncharacterized protein n=1 Tax=Stephania japonica TaxID=461633 RepID=A0AAP0F1V5_9MAGN
MGKMVKKMTGQFVSETERVTVAKKTKAANERMEVVKKLTWRSIGGIGVGSA